MHVLVCGEYDLQRALCAGRCTQTSKTNNRNWRVWNGEQATRCLCGCARYWLCTRVTTRRFRPESPSAHANTSSVVPHTPQQLRQTVAHTHVACFDSFDVVQQSGSMAWQHIHKKASCALLNLRAPCERLLPLPACYLMQHAARLRRLPDG